MSRELEPRQKAELCWSAETMPIMNFAICTKIDATKPAVSAGVVLITLEESQLRKIYLCD